VQGPKEELIADGRCQWILSVVHGLLVAHAQKIITKLMNRKDDTHGIESSDAAAQSMSTQCYPRNEYQAKEGICGQNTTTKRAYSDASFFTGVHYNAEMLTSTKKGHKNQHQWYLSLTSV
jgi:hypothetical protein